MDVPPSSGPTTVSNRTSATGAAYPCGRWRRERAVLSTEHAERLRAGHPGRRRRRAAPGHAHALLRARGPPGHRGARRAGGARARRRAGLRRRAARRRPRRRPGRPRRGPRAARPPRGGADHHAHCARQRGRRRPGPRGGRRRLRHQAVRPRRAAQPHPRRPAPRPGPGRRGRRVRRPGHDRPARPPGHRQRRAGARDVLGVRGPVLPHGAPRQALHPPGAAARDLGRQRLPRPARDRRAHPPPAREARGAPRGAEPDPHGARRGVPLPRAVRRLLRRSGLRGRLLVALVATSALTLAVAAAALLPPLQSRLREQRADDLEAATIADGIGFETELRRILARNRGRPAREVSTALTVGIQDRALDLRQRTGARVVVDDGVPPTDPERPPSVYDTDVAASLPIRQILRTLNDQTDQRTIADGNVTVSVYLAVSQRQPFVLVTQKPLTDVAAAVDQVRTAFLAAAGIGLIVAVVLAIALATTLSRRLARLSAAAVRVAAEGPDAPTPRDDGRDEVGDLARTLATMQQELRRQEAARRAFVSTASHELRTPLTSLQGTLELLEEDLRDGRLDMQDAQRQVVGAQQELRRLARLATELLDLSRLDAAVELRHEPVELGELCRAVGAEFVIQARERDVVVEPPPGPCWAAGDPGAVARVVRILIDNALRYSPPGRPICVTPAYHGDRATVEVADEGPGVAEHDRELIFERFHRGSAASGAGGFGLGLAIGRELAERMGGTLELLDGPPGAGARFMLRLKIELPAGSHHAEPEAEVAA